MLSLSVYCDNISALPAETARPLRRPSVVFRVPDYPTVVIRPGGALHREDAAEETYELDVSRGKSCLM
eukprot:1541464-Prymnesium_polylepis.1